jgi:hypothetical protein
MKEGIKKVQATGRRVQLYVSADIAHRGSALFNASWPASRWAQWWGTEPGQRGRQENLHGGTGFQQNATYICHALQAWQETVAGAVARTVADTGVSEHRRVNFLSLSRMQSVCGDSGILA